MILFIFILMAYSIVFTGGLVLLNVKGLLPGTVAYRLRIEALQNRAKIERARTCAITARMREKEDEHVRRVLALEAPKEVVNTKEG